MPFNRRRWFGICWNIAKSETINQLGIGSALIVYFSIQIIVFLVSALVAGEVSNMLTNWQTWAIPAVLTFLAFLGLLILNWFRAPYIAYSELLVENEQLKSTLNVRAQRQKIADGLSGFMAEGIQLALRPIRKNEYKSWHAEFDAWYGRAIGFITVEMTTADLNIFTFAMPVGQGLYVHVLHGKHRSDLEFIRAKTDALRLMTKNRLYRNI